MIRNFASALMLGLILPFAALAQEDAAPEGEESVDHLMVDPAFSDDPNAIVPAEPSAAERQAEIAADRGPATARAPGAMLRGLDKVTGQSQDLPMEVGQTITFGRLEVLLSECRYPAANPSSDAFAEMKITDTRAKHVVFSGWMIASSPALSALDDSRYDVWVVSCNSA